MNNKPKRNAFTLAEVLIALIVIGVVAALTIPNLVQNYKKTVTTTKLKKFYSTMNQAIQLSIIENGEVYTWNRAPKDLTDEDGEYDYEANANECYQYFLKYLAPYLKYTKAEKTPEKTDKRSELVIFLNDGSTIETHNGDFFDLYYDTNGYYQEPNVFGRDKFAFGIPRREGQAAGGKNFAALYYLDPVHCPDRQTALANCKVNNMLCTALLQFDNWEIKSDYPYKI